MKILLIIPAYNEEKNIKFLVDNIINHYPQHDYIVVNDSSTDKTLEVCQSNNYNYLDLPVNLGIGGGVQAGYVYADRNNYDISIQVDGDGQHDLTYVSSLIDKFKEDSSLDMVIGSRFIEKEGFQSSALRRFGISFLSTIIKLLTGEKFRDVTSGFRASSKELTAYFARNYAHDYPEPEAIVTATLNGFKITEVPVQMKERQSGNSSISGLKNAYYMIKVTLALFICKLQFGKKKVKP